MATEKVALKINIRKNNNAKSEANGKYYAEVETRETLSTRGLAEHMAKHGSLYTLDVLEGVLRKLAICIPELVSEGTPVKLDGLGKFYPTAQSEGATETEVKAGYNPAAKVKGIHIRFMPETAALDNISSRKFKESISLQGNCVVETLRDATTKKRIKNVYVPIAEYFAQVPSNG